MSRIWLPVFYKGYKGSILGLATNCSQWNDSATLRTLRAHVESSLTWPKGGLRVIVDRLIVPVIDRNLRRGPVRATP
jgi:hypothetical protein